MTQMCWTIKTLTIEKISYLKIDDEYLYSFRLKIPLSKLFGKAKWSSKNIAQGIEEEELAQKVDIYYTKEDVQEEGIKRLRFGNSYYQLNNFRGCLREFVVHRASLRKISLSAWIGIPYYEKT